jgi:hypothetical protein
MQKDEWIHYNWKNYIPVGIFDGYRVLKTNFRYVSLIQLTAIINRKIYLIEIFSLLRRLKRILLFNKKL